METTNKSTAYRATEQPDNHRANEPPNTPTYLQQNNEQLNYKLTSYPSNQATNCEQTRQPVNQTMYQTNPHVTNRLGKNLCCCRLYNINQCTCRHYCIHKACIYILASMVTISLLHFRCMNIARHE